MTDFDPANHRMCEPSYFEDLEIGQTFYINSRTQTDALFSAFQLASGDNHPIHYDVEYCKRQGHKGLLAHGLQVLSQAAPGAGIFPHVLGEAMVGFLEVNAKFKAPVYAGDTLYPQLEITELKPGRTTGVVVVRATIHNQDSVLVMDGWQSFLVKKRHPEEKA
ncbi:MaoC family dehydratase [Minwuia sp.]|uniref:MaoC family dehydratase n=1 Tax=Minwuia sp. TaxID=2493630 RepID=UPI003A934526